MLPGCDSATDSTPITVTAPTVVIPTDMDSNVALNPTFTWPGTADNIQIGSNNTFTAVVHSALVTGTSYTAPTNLQPNTLYFWRAGLTVSGRVLWSRIFSFWTKP